MNEFLFLVEDVFYIHGRGTVVTGRVEYGRVYAGQMAFVKQPDGSMVETIVSQIETFRKIQSEACEGQHCGLLLDNISKNDVGAGYTITSTLPTGYTLSSSKPELEKKSWFDRFMK